MTTDVTTDSTVEVIAAFLASWRCLFSSILSRSRSGTIYVKTLILHNLVTCKQFIFFKKMGISGLFFFIFVFSKQLTVSKCSVYIFSDDWIRTADLWNQKRLLYQLSHNHCPQQFIFGGAAIAQRISPKHTIYDFWFFFKFVPTIFACIEKRTEINKKRMGLAHTLKSSSFLEQVLSGEIHLKTVNLIQ